VQTLAARVVASGQSTTHTGVFANQLEQREMAAFASAEHVEFTTKSRSLLGSVDEQRTALRTVDAESGGQLLEAWAFPRLGLRCKHGSHLSREKVPVAVMQNKRGVVVVVATAGSVHFDVFVRMVQLIGKPLGVDALAVILGMRDMH
jgi:hypothetical protein